MDDGRSRRKSFHHPVIKPGGGGKKEVRVALSRLIDKRLSDIIARLMAKSSLALINSPHEAENVLFRYETLN